MILNAFIETDIMSFYYTCFVKLCKRNTSRKNIIGFYPPPLTFYNIYFQLYLSSFHIQFQYLGYILQYL